MPVPHIITDTQARQFPPSHLRSVYRTPRAAPRERPSRHRPIFHGPIRKRTFLPGDAGQGRYVVLVAPSQGLFCHDHRQNQRRIQCCPDANVRLGHARRGNVRCDSGGPIAEMRFLRTWLRLIVGPVPRHHDDQGDKRPRYCACVVQADLIVNSASPIGVASFLVLNASIHIDKMIQVHDLISAPQVIEILDRAWMVDEGVRLRNV